MQFNLFKELKSVILKINEDPFNAQEVTAGGVHKKCRSSCKLIFGLRKIIEHRIEFQKSLFLKFLDLKKSIRLTSTGFTQRNGSTHL